MSDQVSSCIDRQQAEIALLEAMYPEQVTWYNDRSELQYKPVSGGLLTLRLPAGYPETEKVIVLTAVDRHKSDISTWTKAQLEKLDLHGEEAVDAVLQAFEDMLEKHVQITELRDASHVVKDIDSQLMFKTVVIWLHHLLNTNKRKLATHPSAKIVGITKPGYPGVLLYSGPKDDVDSHVAELKDQRWQAFQVRFEVESRKPWGFTHPSGVREVESMSEVSQAIKEAEHRETFLKAIHIK